MSAVELAPPRAGRYRAELATPADDEEVRRLLREAAMEGAVRVALACEPDAARAAALEGPEHQRVVLRDAGSRELAAIGSRSVRERYVDGRPARVGYYGQLRIDGARATLVRPGFAAMRELHERDGCTQVYFASVVRGNEVAQRLLRAGLRGLPACVPAGALVTLLVSARRAPASAPPGLALERGRPELLHELVACLDRNLRRFQLAPRWTADDLLDAERTRGLALEHFCLVLRRGRVVGCAALWDQRASKQTIVRGYARSLALARPIWNLWARAASAPRLPLPGSALAMAFASHLAVDGDDPQVARALFDALRADARERGIALVAVGLDARHPLLPALARGARAWRYESDVLLMPWPEHVEAARALGGAPLQPEVAVL